MLARPHEGRSPGDSVTPERELLLFNKTPGLTGITWIYINTWNILMGREAGQKSVSKAVRSLD